MRPFLAIGAALERERGHLFPWVPVCLGAGIAIYFTLTFEPGLLHYGLVALGGLSLLVWQAYWHEALRPVGIALVLVLAGVLVAGLRAHTVAGPQLTFRYYGPVEGRIRAIDRSQSDKVRLTLDRVVLSRVSPARTPRRIRISLHGPQGYLMPEPGLTVILTGHLSPPQGPVEPGGFDFQRKAWFDQLGAVGYTRSPALALAAAEEGSAGLLVHRIRMALSAAVQRAIPGENGAFAAAIITGDRSGMGQETVKDLRRSNLAHLLAISGLHMGLLTGFVFAVLRYAMALIPKIALCWPTKKIAAGGALVIAAIYLALSGGNVATERAFVMAAVMLVAIMLGRRALTLRAVALAAVIVLTLRPEALTGPGFQMSFAATTALIGVFGWLRDAEFWQARFSGWMRALAALVVSSAVAGLATAPFAAAHFNQIAHYGLLANLLTVPVMGTVVMPAAVLAALLYPIGLAEIGLTIMETGIGWILGVAGWVAGTETATSHVATPALAVLPLIALGGLFLVIWQSRIRVAGLAGIAAGFLVWSVSERPDLLVSDTGELIGLMTGDGRAVNKEKGQGFIARSWLENDGDIGLQAQAFRRTGLTLAPGQARFSLGNQSFIQLTGKSAPSHLAASCTEGALVILAADAEAPPGCQVWDQSMLRRTGALAIFLDGGKLRTVAARDLSGNRLWNSRPDRRQ